MQALQQSLALNEMPPPDEMYAAVVARDTTYDGVFVTAVRTTGIFCRPGCPAKTPRRENVEFHATVREALAAGFRPCQRCRPLDPRGAAPELVKQLLEAVDREPERRFTDAELRAAGYEPERVRRWFKLHHGMTFHAYVRARRVGRALRHLQEGADVTGTGFDAGWESASGFRDAFAALVGDAPGRSRNAVVVNVDRILTPLGPMLAGATDRGLCLLEFTDRPMLETQLRRVRRRLGPVAPSTSPHLTQAADELRRYFAGELRRFTVPLDLRGTPFQERVWQVLTTIPYGETRSYQAQAAAIAAPEAVRAVARANGDNRIAIVVPCHRVIGKDGSLTGYGGGLWRKKWLLAHEQARDTRGQR